MENASKALIIAGGILLALILLATFVYLFGLMTQNTKEQDRVQLMEQIAEFNKQYESYERNLLRGVDIASVCNKANNYNIQNEKKDIKERIVIHVTLMADWENLSKNTDYIMTDRTIFDFDKMKKNESSKFYEFKIKYFKCTKVEYSRETGKVTAMYFKEINGMALLKNEIES